MMSDLIIDKPVVDEYQEHALHKKLLKFRMEKRCSECYKERQAILARSRSRFINKEEGLYERLTREYKEDAHFNPNPFN